MVWCPKPTPSAADEALQCRAGGAPVRRSEEIRKRSNALDFPDVRISQKHLSKALRINLISDGTSGASRNRPFQWDNSTWASGQVRLRLHPSQAQKPSMQLLSGQLARCLSFALLFFMSSCLCLSLLFLSFTLRCLSFALPCGNGLAGFRQHIGKKRKQISENNRNYYFFRRQSGANAMRVDRADKGAT